MLLLTNVTISPYQVLSSKDALAVTLLAALILLLGTIVLAVYWMKYCTISGMVKTAEKKLHNEHEDKLKIELVCCQPQKCIESSLSESPVL